MKYTPHIDLKQIQETLDFLDSIEGHGYGGMAAFEIARMNLRAALGLIPSNSFQFPENNRV